MAGLLLILVMLLEPGLAFCNCTRFPPLPTQLPCSTLNPCLTDVCASFSQASAFIGKKTKAQLSWTPSVSRTIK